MRDGDFKSVLHSFADSLENTPDDVAVYVHNPYGEEAALSYADIYHGAGRVAAVYRELGTVPGDRVLLMLPTSKEFLFIYFAALFSGVVPIITATPRKRGPIDSLKSHLESVITNIQAKYIVVPGELNEMVAGAFSVKTVTVERLCREIETREWSSPDSLDLNPCESDIAHLQATSGSTGAPKVAVVRHGNIAANVKGIGIAIEHRRGDILTSWLPLSHDMGLIGISYALYWQCPLVITDTINFIRNPINWLRMITRYKGTLAPAPNSAFQICARLGQLRTFTDLDLSSWRVALCGSEPIHADTIRQFTKTFAPYGFPEKTMLPVYGLAEATLAVTIPDVNAVPGVETIDALLMETTGRCIPVTDPAKRQLEMVSVGRPLEAHRVRIVDENGAMMEDRQIGEVEFYGPSVISGYWGEPENDPTLKRSDGFMRTGDQGYTADGELYITGRSKDIIIIHGRNFVPGQIEASIQKVIDNNLPNSVAVCGLQDENTKTEMLHIIIEHRGTLPEDEREEKEAAIRDAMAETYSLTGITIHWVGRGQIPKTTSGKIQRHQCRELLRAGTPI